jgi:hypothetical protein
MNEVTRVLSAIEQGEPHAAEQLLPLVYDALLRLAAEKMARERPGQTLQATALVHEAYARLVGAGVFVHHVYVTAGSYTMRVTATDQHEAVSDPSTMPVTVSRVLLTYDGSLQPVLVIGGTPLDDEILVSAGPNPGDVAVRMNGIDEGVF